MKKAILVLVISLLTLATIFFGTGLSVCYEQSKTLYEQNKALSAEVDSLTQKLENSGDQIKELSMKLSEYEYAEISESTDLSWLKGAAADFHEDAKWCLAGNTPVIYVQLSPSDDVEKGIRDFYQNISEKVANLLVWHELFSDEVQAEPFVLVLIDSNKAVILQCAIEMDVVDLEQVNTKVSISIGADYLSIVDKIGSLM